jgi:hypothetical protein
MLENHEFILRIEFSENRKQYNEEFRSRPTFKKITKKSNITKKMKL